VLALDWGVGDVERFLGDDEPENRSVVWDVSEGGVPLVAVVLICS